MNYVSTVTLATAAFALSSACGANMSSPASMSGDAAAVIVEETQQPSAAPSIDGCECCNWGISGTEQPPDFPGAFGKPDPYPRSCVVFFKSLGELDWCAMHCPIPM